MDCIIYNMISACHLDMLVVSIMRNFMSIIRQLCGFVRNSESILVKINNNVTKLQMN